MYDLVKKRTVMARDVEFKESDQFNFDGDHESIPVGGETYVNLPLSSCSEEADDVEEQIVRKSAREKKQPNRLGEWAYFLNELHEPETVQEARASLESGFWQKTTQNEINSMYKNEVGIQRKRLGLMEI